jgi:hypothetical protein
MVAPKRKKKNLLKLLPPQKLKNQLKIKNLLLPQRQRLIFQAYLLL